MGGDEGCRVDEETRSNPDRQDNSECHEVKRTISEGIKDTSPNGFHVTQ